MKQETLSDDAVSTTIARNSSIDIRLVPRYLTLVQEVWITNDQHRTTKTRHKLHDHSNCGPGEYFFFELGTIQNSE